MNKYNKTYLSSRLHTDHKLNVMTMMDDLPELEDILDEIQYHDLPGSFLDNITQNESMEIINTFVQIMYDYVCNNPKSIQNPDFEEEMVESVQDLFTSSLMEIDDSMDYIQAQEYASEMFIHALDVFYIQIMPKRSQSTKLLKTKNKQPPSPKKNVKMSAETLSLQETLTYLKSMPQPEQRTPEWYKYRHNLITASNAYKIFDPSPYKRNELIYEKCKPLDIQSWFTDSMQDNDNKMVIGKTIEKINPFDKVGVLNVNTESPLHWGQKYEPVSTLYYEHIHNTQVGEYGCIQHSEYSFIGASPDGIVDDVDSEKYGTMVEIKNVVNREITGIPKLEYWIQMQLQMETCNLEECDFLETRFKEYETEGAFCVDVYDNDTCDSSQCKDPFVFNKDGKYKGIILCFADSNGIPIYEYKPIGMTKNDYNNKWFPMIIEKHAIAKNYYVKTCYWWLEEVSLVLVMRNKLWFSLVIDEMKMFWDTILKERETGYSHRAPSKRVSKKKEDPLFSSCLVSIKSKDDNIDDSDTNSENTGGDDNTNRSEPGVLHIRTLSIDETNV